MGCYLLGFTDKSLENAYIRSFNTSRTTLDIIWSVYNVLLAGVAVARAVRDGQSGWQAVAIVLAAMPVLVLGTLKRDLYMQHRSAVISAVRVLRTGVILTCEMPQFGATPAAKAFYGAGFSLMFESLVLGSSIVGYQLPFASHWWVAALMLGLSLSTNIPRCLVECTTPWHAQHYTALATVMQKGTALLPLPAHFPDREELSARQACWAVRGTLQAVLGVAVPTAALALVEDVSRAHFLVRNGRSDREIGDLSPLHWRLLLQLPLLVPAALLSWHVARLMALALP